MKIRGSKHQPSGSGWFLISGFFLYVTSPLVAFISHSRRKCIIQINISALQGQWHHAQMWGLHQNNWAAGIHFLLLEPEGGRNLSQSDGMSKAELSLNWTPSQTHEIGKAPSLEKLQHGILFRRVYLALNSSTAGTVSVKAAIVSLTRVLVFFSRKSQQ